MLNVEKWAQNKNPLIAFFAISLALIAREKSEALRCIKERKLYGYQFPLPDLPSWFAMYQSRKPVYAYKRLIANTSGLADEQIRLFSGLRKINKYLKQRPELPTEVTFTQEKLQESHKYWQDLCALLIEDVKEDIAQTSLSPEINDKVRNALVNDELPLGFYFLVHAPCILFYETTPASLYRKALNRDVAAIENLLKLDPLILHDPAIGFQIQSVRLYGKANEYEGIIDAITKQPRINYKKLKDERRSIKSDYGAQVYALSKALNSPLLVPEIRGLYDALAHDFDGSLVDTDIGSPESFDKTIRTKATSWQERHQLTEKQK